VGVSASGRLRPAAVLPVIVFAVAVALQTAVVVTAGLPEPAATLLLTALLPAVPVAIGLLVSLRAPAVPVGPAVTWVGTAPAVVFALERWAGSGQGRHPWPGAHVVHLLQLGAWVWLVVGFAALCLVFPAGLLPGRRWRVAAWSVALSAAALHVLAGFGRHGDLAALPGWQQLVLEVAGFGGFLGALLAAVASLVVRWRHGDERVRQQLRWLLLGAGAVPVLLAAGWVAEAAGASVGVAYTAFIVVMLVAVPAAVAVAVLRHELFDVDRLLGASLAWLLTSVISAAVFAAVATAAGDVLGRDSRLGVAGAALITALLLLPLQRRLNGAVGRVVDRERHVLTARLLRFVRQVRDGEAEPEQAEEVLRAALGDPRLRLLLRLPGAGGYVDLTGAPAAPADDGAVIPLTAGGADAGLIVLGGSSPRRLRRGREAARHIRLAIEVSRLRLELRVALREVRDSRARLVEAAAGERRRLERDLHDGAQQHLVAVGMRLRSLQRRLPPHGPEHGELDLAVEALEATVGELRRLANGVRPGRLDDGMSAALRALVADAPLPVRLTVRDVALPEVVATTVYFVVAEAYANALKHSGAGTVGIDVGPDGAGAVHVRVVDDGVGGAAAQGPASVRDRVASVGGTVTVHSPPGGGTRMEVTVPCASS
jgi:signal transduction histidine kinase